MSNKEGHIFYSASRDSFFDDRIKARYQANNNWPDDLVAVKEEKFVEFVKDKTSEGKIRGADSDGHPCWLSYEEPARTKAKRNLLNFEFDGVTYNMTPSFKTRLSVALNLNKSLVYDGGIITADEVKELSAAYFEAENKFYEDNPLDSDGQ